MHTFSDRASASAQAARLLATQLTHKLESQPRASLAVSGGSTPAVCLETLARLDLPWNRVDITLTDERHVPNTHPASNEKMVKEKLLRFNAAAARFFELSNDTTLQLQPFAGTLVGMGEDGHFASLFPDSAQLDAGLASPCGTIDISTPSSPHSRTSMTLSQLAKSDLIILLVFGNSKRRIVEAPAGFPVDHLLKRAPVNIIWAP
jgi:6-phosphogluconolactonase